MASPPRPMTTPTFALGITMPSSARRLSCTHGMALSDSHVTLLKIPSMGAVTRNSSSQAKGFYG